MSKIEINPELESLIPAPSADELASLEASLVQEGCRDPLVVYEPEGEGGPQILLDGHNRLRICKEKDINIPETVVIAKGVKTLEDGKIWIINNQLARRNLGPLHIRHLRGLHYHAEKAKTSNPTGANQHVEVDAQNEHQPKKTAERLGDVYNVSPATIRRDAEFAAAVESIVGNVGPAALAKILNGKKGLNIKQVLLLAENLSRQEQQEALAGDVASTKKILKSLSPNKSVTPPAPKTQEKDASDTAGKTSESPKQAAFNYPATPENNGFPTGPAEAARDLCAAFSKSPEWLRQLLGILRDPGELDQLIHILNNRVAELEPDQGE